MDWRTALGEMLKNQETRAAQQAREVTAVAEALHHIATTEQAASLRGGQMNPTQLDLLTQACQALGQFSTLTRSILDAFGLEWVTLPGYTGWPHMVLLPKGSAGSVNSTTIVSSQDRHLHAVDGVRSRAGGGKVT